MTLFNAFQNRLKNRPEFKKRMDEGEENAVAESEMFKVIKSLVLRVEVLIL